MVAVLAGGGWYYFRLSQGVPSVNSLEDLFDPIHGQLLEPTRFYDRTGKHVILTLQNPSAEGRQYLQLNDGSLKTASGVRYLASATVATLDPGFWKEPGFHLSGAGTHPTLAEQLVSDLLLAGMPASPDRNLLERILAFQVTIQFGRQKVLEWFLNSAQYGDHIYGADAAARVYFGKPADQLTLAEAAVLTAIAATPGIDPWTSGQLLRENQALVIHTMLDDEIISADEALEAIEQNIQLQPEQGVQSLAPSFTNQALLQLSSYIPLSLLYRGGYEITTSLDYDLQIQVDCTMQEQLNRLQGFPELAVTIDGSACKASFSLPADQAGVGEQPAGLRTSIIILDPQKGEILAWAGQDETNFVPTSAPTYPAGTILSPFAYLSAFAHGMSPATLLWDLPVSNDPNSSGSKESLVTYHGPVRLRTALNNDYAGAMAEVLQQVGWEDVLSTESKFGISTVPVGRVAEIIPDDYYSQPVSLLDAVQAYGILANHGVMAGQSINGSSSAKNGYELHPITILDVMEGGGQVWLDWSDTQVQPIVSEQLAYLTTNVLSDEKTRLTSIRNTDLLDIGRPAAVKVSRSSDGKNAWTVGYTPQLVVGVWMGIIQGNEADLTPDMSAELWRAVLQDASSTLPVQDFMMPEGISQVQVCDPSGMLVSPSCPSMVNEVFLKGNEPSEIDNLYQEVLIDRDSGLLATIFTPADLVERKLFLTVPSKAKAWAEAVGLPLPPDTYDEIDAYPSQSIEVQISTPTLLMQVSGQVELYGSAAGEGFSHYRLQFGQGENPQEWTQIGEDSYQPVQNGKLGTWDTTDLDGIYVIELLIVKQDLQLEKAITLVNVDNIAPQVQIIAPKENERFTYQANQSIILQADAKDNQTIQTVEFYLDDQLLLTLYAPPYMSSWQAEPGQHTLRVTAYDGAGNLGETITSFSVSK